MVASIVVEETLGDTRTPENKCLRVSLSGAATATPCLPPTPAAAVEVWRLSHRESPPVTSGCTDT